MMKGLPDFCYKYQHCWDNYNPFKSLVKEEENRYTDVLLEKGFPRLVVAKILEYLPFAQTQHIIQNCYENKIRYKKEMDCAGEDCPQCKLKIKYMIGRRVNYHRECLLPCRNCKKSDAMYKSAFSEIQDICKICHHHYLFNSRAFEKRKRDTFEEWDALIDDNSDEHTLEQLIDARRKWKRKKSHQ